MKNQFKLTLVGITLLAATAAGAQSAGSWMARIGITQITPHVTSGCLSAPDFGDLGAGGALGCTRIGVSNDTQLGGGISYMLSDNVSVDVPLALAFKHQILGDGSMQGAGVIGTVSALPVTVFLQYRFMPASAKFRPYVGLGATYAHFFDEQGSGRLTATTNPGGPATHFSVDSKFILTPQLGATLALDEKTFIDFFYSRSRLRTTTKMSTGQQIESDLDPSSLGLAVGFRF